MKIYVQKQIQTLYTPNNKKQSMKFNIIKQNESSINHIHGESIDNKGHVLKIKLKKYKISDFRQHIKNKDSYKLNSNEIYKIYDESKIKSITKSLKTVDKKKKKPSTKTSKTVDKKKKKPSTKKSTKSIDKKKKKPSKTSTKSMDKKTIIKKKSKISKK
jgi:hypothetical protein